MIVARPREPGGARHSTRRAADSRVGARAGVTLLARLEIDIPVAAAANDGSFHHCTRVALWTRIAIGIRVVRRAPLGGRGRGVGDLIRRQIGNAARRQHRDRRQRARVPRRSLQDRLPDVRREYTLAVDLNP